MSKDFSNVPVVVTLANKGEEVVGVRLFKVNLVEEIAAGDELKITCPSSEEVAYYMEQANDAIKLEVTKE